MTLKKLEDYGPTFQLKVINALLKNKNFLLRSTSIIEIF